MGADRRLTRGATIAVLGGSGFVGRHVVQALARRGYRLRVGVRKPNQALFLRPMGDVGQVEPVQVNIRDEASVCRLLDGVDATVNLVGILHETGAQRFETVQAGGAERVARLAALFGADKVFVHMSALGAVAESTSVYARSKAHGEEGVREHQPQASILRPSVVFGPEDDFFNRFAALARLAPALPLIGGGKSRFQPVYVKDIADAAVHILESEHARGRIYELGGPEIYSFRELMELVLREINRSRLLMPLPLFAAKIAGGILQLAPKPLLTLDQVRLLAQDNIVSDKAAREGRVFAGLGIVPTAAEAILPTYLYRFRRTGQFEHIRAS